MSWFDIPHEIDVELEGQRFKPNSYPKKGTEQIVTTFHCFDRNRIPVCIGYILRYSEKILFLSQIPDPSKADPNKGIPILITVVYKSLSELDFKAVSTKKDYYLPPYNSID